MKARGGRAAEVSFSNIYTVGQRLEGQPHEVLLTIAARAALRALPRIAISRNGGDLASAIALPVFRCTAVAWAAAAYPARRAELAAHAAAAKAAGVTAGFTAGDGPDEAARRAAYAASDAAAAAAATDSAGATPAATFAAIYSATLNAEAPDADAAAAIGDDAAFIERVEGAGNRAASAVGLAGASLWSSGGEPDWASAGWRVLKDLLLAADEGWGVWINWYEDRLAGRPSLGEAFDIAVATLPDDLWKQGPAAVNAEIRRLIGVHTPPEPIPAQGAGPHFALSPAHRIGLAAASDIDAAGNNLGRLRQQLPLVREAADDLAGRLNPNAFPELVRNLASYRAAIEGEPEGIAWGVVFGRGVRLDNSAAAARRQIEDRLQPLLEDAAQEALDSVLMLHGPMILATAEGRELMDDANRMLLTREQQAALRADALAVATALNDDKEIIEPPAAKLVMESVETIGEGPHPERGSVAGGAAIRNVTIWAVGIGAIAAIAGVGFVQAGAAVVAIEGLKKSKRFSALTDALGARIDGVLRTGAAFQNFVIRNEQSLRQMASNSAGMRWMLPYIDDVVRQHAGKSPPTPPDRSLRDSCRNLPTRR
jgi:hypothetical protein